jgi:hypothetical protein
MTLIATGEIWGMVYRCPAVSQEEQDRIVEEKRLCFDRCLLISRDR